MNKKIKRIIACTLAIAAFSAIGPTKYFDLMTMKAYASSSKAYLNDIDVDHGHLSFSSTDTSYTVRVSSSVDDINIDTSADSDYEVTIDGHEGDSRTIDLDHGSNRIRIRVKDKTGDKDPVTYYVNVIRGSSSYYDDYDYYDDNDDDYYDDDIYLENISVNQGALNFSRSTSKYAINVAESVNKIDIKANPEHSRDDVSIDGVIVNKDSNYTRTIDLSQGTNIVKVTVTNPYEHDYDENYDKRVYTLYINRGTATTTTNSGETDTKQDYIYLDKLLIDSGNTYLGFDRRITTYNVNVSDKCDEIILTGEPEDSGDVVRVNGERVDSNGKRIVKLNQGNNEIKVKVSNEDDNFDDNNDYRDNYEQRIYTINVHRGSTNTTTTANSTNVTVKADQWVNVMGRWQYNDSLGNALINAWYSDRSSGKVYYLDSQGYMATGWINPNGAWYYLDGNGVRQTGWKQINGKWYYLDAEGKMASNTTIGGYKLGADGALV